MALKLRSVPSVDDPQPQRLDDDQEYSKWLAIRRDLTAGQAARQAAAELMQIENELARPLGSTTGPRGQLLRDRAATLRAAAPPPSPELPPADDALPVDVRDGLKLLAGGAVAPAPDRQQRLTALRTELTVIEKALAVTEGQLDEIRAARSLDASLRLRNRHQATLLTIYNCALALTAAWEAERKIIASLLAENYQPRLDVLPRPYLPGAARIGSPDFHDSEINVFKRTLQAQGVL